MELVDIIGCLGFILTMFVVGSPIPSLLEGIKNGNIKNMTLEYILLAAAQGVLWLLFGIKENDFYVRLTNSFVVSAYIIYLNIFLYILKNKEKTIYLNLGFFTYITFCSYFLPGKVCLTAGAIVSTVWQFTTISKIRLALQSKDASFLNYTIALASFVVFNFWAAYALLTTNYIMFCPNFFGGLIFTANLLIYYWASGRLSHNNFSIEILKKIFFITSSKAAPQPLLDLNTSSSGYNKL